MASCTVTTLGHEVHGSTKCGEWKRSSFAFAMARPRTISSRTL
jgi:hypothetical protein